MKTCWGRLEIFKLYKTKPSVLKVVQKVRGTLKPYSKIRIIKTTVLVMLMDQLLVLKMSVKVRLDLWKEPQFREGMRRWGKAKVARSFLLREMSKCRRLNGIRSVAKVRKEWKLHRKLAEVVACKAIDQKDSIKMNTKRKNNNKRNFLKSTIRYSNRPKKRLEKKKQKYKNWCRNCRKQRKGSHKNQLLVPEFL